jgi:serine protease AprX
MPPGAQEVINIGQRPFGAVRENLNAITCVMLLALVPLAAGQTTESYAGVDARLVQELAVGEATAIAVLTPGAMAHVTHALDELGLAWHSYDALDQVALRLTMRDLPSVRSIVGVESIWANEVMMPYLDRSAPYIGANILWNTYNIRGTGVTIMVVDTGVDGTHPDTRFQVNLIENVVPTRAANNLIGGYVEGVPVSDVDGHGTHVASIAAGTAAALGASDPNQGKYHGIAYQSKLVGFAAGLTTPNGDTRFDSVTVLEAFNYAIQNAKRLDIRVVTNSWGTNGAFEPSNPIVQASFNMYRAGLVVTFAAGNEGEDGLGTLNKYCVAPWVLCVGAGDYLNRRASFSSQGTDPAQTGKAYDHPDLIAPGVGIMAAKAVLINALDPPSLTQPANLVTNAEYSRKSGTSMATPHVAGAAALLLSSNPQLSPDQVYDILVASTTTLPGAKVWEVGAGYLNLFEAHKTAKGVEGNLAEFLQGRVKYGGKATGDPDHSEDPVSVGLGRGGSKSIVGGDVSIAEFAKQLTTTPSGLVFLIGAPLLFIAAFSLRPKVR